MSICVLPHTFLNLFQFVYCIFAENKCSLISSSLRCEFRSWLNLCKRPQSLPHYYNIQIQSMHMRLNWIGVIRHDVELFTLSCEENINCKHNIDLTVIWTNVWCAQKKKLLITLICETYDMMICQALVVFLVYKCHRWYR